MSYIKFENISKRYGANEVLKNINLEIKEGQLVTLLGPSGCGKSTLLRCLAGLEEVSEGKIYLDGKDITNLDPKNRNIGMVFQQYSLFPNMTIEQNVAFGLKMKKMNKAKMDEKVMRMLDIVGLKDKAKAYPAQLSGGQQQRVALARAIVTEPKVLLLDEPLSAIDALLRHSLQAEIRRIQKELNITAIFVTHDQDEAMVMSDMIHLMYQGQIEQSATPADMYINPASVFAATFIGHYNLLSYFQFMKICGTSIDAHHMAFRPEMVDICMQKKEAENLYSVKGVVKDCIPHGNVIRYTMDCNGEMIDVDKLFTDTMQYEEGSICYLQIPKESCIYF